MTGEVRLELECWSCCDDDDDNVERGLEVLKSYLIMGRDWASASRPAPSTEETANNEDKDVS